ncbi:hypothetical protein AXF42_Ash003607 [Apostasia shenzhenica]|uniref:Transmembrane protein 53 n=1 Tax=Apostasia shenzhenica TaxID=1088818 RepID=A0A2I0AHE0_9ASPA|nr:hypothetical protein AXF42_Ash003607 [Apostasia shenzhenica]
MASLYGNLHRPLSAIAALAIATVSSVSSDYLPDRFSGPKSRDGCSPLVPSSSDQPALRPSSSVSVSNPFGISFISRTSLLMNSGISHSVDFLFGSSPSSFSLPPALLALYGYAKLSDPSRSHETSLRIIFSSSDTLYRWHLPDPSASGMLGKSNSSLEKSQTVVVLLGWLGAKQKHLKRYAEWYTSRGFHAVTFTFPMSEIVSYKAGGKAEKDLELLADHLADWVAEETGKNLVFHTFSNTGWLTYGVILEKFQKQYPSAMRKIKGCIVDSAPVAAPDPQVWASGFSAAYLKKQSVATKGVLNSSSNSGRDMLMVGSSLEQQKPAMVEAALLTVLEKFFEVVLNLPAINRISAATGVNLDLLTFIPIECLNTRRLSDVLDLLSMGQPNCPQLYIYSSADRVIPAKHVESFAAEQRRAGHEVRECNFVNSPHVDHFRNHPSLYSSQLTSFLEDCVLISCKKSS